MDAKILSEVVAAITERTASAGNTHMLKPWEMVFGGLVLPMMADMDPSVAKDPKYAELVGRYSREAVEEFFRDRKVVVEKTVEKQVEVVKVIERLVGGTSGARKPTMHDTVEALGKFRRFKESTAEKPRKLNDIPPKGRDAVNKWWNLNQRLTHNGEAVAIANEINGWDICKPLSGKQVGGWLAWLCVLATKLDADRSDYITRATKHGKFKVVPVFSTSLVDAALNFRRTNKENRDAAKAAKERMKREVIEAMKTSPSAVEAAKAPGAVKA